MAETLEAGQSGAAKPSTPARAYPRPHGDDRQLIRRNERTPSSWASRVGSDYPALVIYVRGDLAAIYYYRADDGRAGFVSIGGKMNLDPKKMTTFQIGGFNPGDTIDVLNDSIVPFSEALEVARKFFHSQELPRSIEWFEL
jgi:hypothetical protein